MTVPNRIPSQLDTVDYYADRLRRYDDLADRRSAFSAMVESLADDRWFTPETVVARVRLAVAALRQVEAEARDAR